MKRTRRILDIYDSILVRLAHLYIGSLAVNAAVPETYKENPFYYVSGFLAGAIGRTLDHISTIPGIKLINTKKFKEKKMSSQFYETNIFVGKNPTMKKYILSAIPQDLILLGITTCHPNLGYSYLSEAFITHINNKRKTKDLEEELK